MNQTVLLPSILSYNILTFNHSNTGKTAILTIITIISKYKVFIISKFIRIGSYTWSKYCRINIIIKLYIINIYPAILYLDCFPWKTNYSLYVYLRGINRILFESYTVNRLGPLNAYDILFIRTVLSLDSVSSIELPTTVERQHMNVTRT